MRKLPLLVVFALAIALGVAGIAQAINSKQNMAVKLAKNKAGTAKKPANVGKLTVDLSIDVDPSDKPFATTDVVLSFDKNLVFNSAKFKSCTEAQVRAHSAVCKAAKVGTGVARGDATFPDGTKIGQDLTVAGYNGPKGKTLLLNVQGSSPLSIDDVIVGKLVKGKGAYGKKLVVKIPANLQQPVAGVYATLTKFKTIVGGVQKKVPYIGLKGCPKKKLAFQGDFTFTDGSKKTLKPTVACKK